MNEENKKYFFIGKTLFFPKEKLICVGDLHLGYDEMLRQKGLEINLKQFEEIISELDKTIQHIKAKYGKPEWIVFLGDIKHSFGYMKEERDKLNLLLRFLKKYFEENKIIFIKGNHERNEKNEKFLDYFIIKDVGFIHGDREILEVYDKTINLIVMGHLHPTVTLSDKQRVKMEKYKCFLVGKHKKKEIVVVPSFSSITEGIDFKDFSENERDFSIVPQAELNKFKVFVASEIGEESFDFGALGKIN